MFINKLIN